MHEHELALAREVDEPLHVARSMHAVVGLCGNEQSSTRGRGCDACHASSTFARKSTRADVHALDGRAREHRREQVDRVARARHERDVAGAEQHPEQVHEPFLRAERERRLGLGIELDAVAVAVEVADRLPELRQPAARRVAVVARDAAPPRAASRPRSRAAARPGCRSRGRSRPCPRAAARASAARPRRRRTAAARRRSELGHDRQRRSRSTVRQKRSAGVAERGGDARDRAQERRRGASSSPAR